MGSATLAAKMRAVRFQVQAAGLDPERIRWDLVDQALDAGQSAQQVARHEIARQREGVGA